MSLLALVILAVLAVAPTPAVSAGPDGSGPRAVAHRAGGRAIDSPKLARNAPDPALHRLGIPSGEPTLGVTEEGWIFTSAIQSNFRIEVLRSKNDGKSWEIVSPKFPGGRNAQLVTFDPYTWVDPWTSRVYTIDLTVACSYLSYTDDRGKSWITNPLACGRPINDHQTLFSGPPKVSVPVGYPNVVYYCWNDVASSSCSKSLDGGITFSPTGSPAYPGYDPTAEDEDKLCGGLHGHGHVGKDGTVYLPRGYCGQPWLAISNDEGASWTRVQVAKNGVSHHEASVAADRKGNVYYMWVAKDRLPYLAVSRDGGKSWSKPMMVGGPGTKEANLPTLAVGGVGKVAMAYMGSENSPYRPGREEPAQECTLLQPCPPDKRYDKVTWNGYMTISADALSRRPVFYTATVNDPRDPLKRRNCGPGRCGTTIYDFIDVTIAPDGTAWSAMVDACLLVCVTTPPNDGGNEGIVGQLVGGPKLSDR